MRRSLRAAIPAMLIALTISIPPADASAQRVRFLSARAAGETVRCFVVSAERVGRWLTSPFRSQRPRDDRRMRSESGWQALSFRLDDEGQGVYLSVKGSVVFESAWVTYDDGGEEPFALHQAIRADGLFAVTEFPSDRRVRDVSIVARAITPSARVGVLLGR